MYQSHPASQPPQQMASGFFPPQMQMQAPVAARPATSRMPAALFLALIVIPNALARLGAGDYASKRYGTLGVLFFSSFSLVSAVGFSVLLYKMWSAIHDGQARTTPGKALGMMFVPFYNLYWIFQVVPGWKRDFDAFCARHGIRARASMAPLLGWILAMPIPMLLQASYGVRLSSPIEATLFTAVTTCFYTLYVIMQTWAIVHICDRVNTIAEHTSTPAQPPYR